VRRIVVVSAVSPTEKLEIENVFISAEVGFLYGWVSFLESLLPGNTFWQHKPVDVLFMDLGTIGSRARESIPAAVSIIGTAVAEGLVSRVVVVGTSPLLMKKFAAFVRMLTSEERLGRWWSSSKCGKHCMMYQQNELLCWTLVPRPRLPPQARGAPPYEKEILWVHVFIHLHEAGFWRANP